MWDLHRSLKTERNKSKYIFWPCSRKSEFLPIGSLQGGPYTYEWSEKSGIFAKRSALRGIHCTGVCLCLVLMSALYVRHCITEFKKQVLPRLCRPGPISRGFFHRMSFSMCRLNGIREGVFDQTQLVFDIQNTAVRPPGTIKCSGT